jgi:prepilin-type N-terminal cleavage/methylation domain-containing protein
MRRQTRHHGKTPGPAGGVPPRRRGFTLVELLVAIVIILVIIGLTIVSVNVAISGGRQQAERATVQGLALAVEQFTQEFGFPPPLVQDGLQGVGGAMTVQPVQISRGNEFANGFPLVVPMANDRIRAAAVYNPAFTRNRRFLEGLSPAGGAPSIQETIDRYQVGTQAWREANQRYSKYTLAYYLTGAMPAAVDGVDGPGMVRPLADGTFEGVIAASADALETNGQSTSRNRFEAFYEADRGTATIVREYFDLEEYRENEGDAALTVADPSSETDWRHAAIVDGNGRAYRYYRWEPLSGSYGIQTSATCQLNIPWVLLDDDALEELIVAGEAEAPNIDVTGGNAELRGARWAIVGAGPDGLFGTEPFETLRQRLPRPEFGTDEANFRALAKQDNVMEVGR